MIFFQKQLYVLGRNGVSDATWFFQDRFLGFFYKHAVYHTNNLTRIRIIQGTATVTRIGDSVNLEYIIG